MQDKSGPVSDIMEPCRREINNNRGRERKRKEPSGNGEERKRERAQALNQVLEDTRAGW